MNDFADWSRQMESKLADFESWNGGMEAGVADWSHSEHPKLHDAPADARAALSKWKNSSPPVDGAFQVHRALTAAGYDHVANALIEDWENRKPGRPVKQKLVNWYAKGREGAAVEHDQHPDNISGSKEIRVHGYDPQASVKDYNPDEPRGDDGRWGDGGLGGGAAADTEDSNAAADKTAVKLSYSPPKATLDEIDNRLKLTPAQKTEAAAKLKSLCDNAHMFTRVKIATLPMILEGGFKTQFETGTSAAAFNPGMRSEAEANGIGVPPGISPKKRPFYAYLHSEPDGANACRSYGGVKIKFKDSIRPRCTMAVGDSLGGMLDKTQAAMPLNNPSHYALGLNANGSKMDILKNAKNVQDLDPSFTEIQVHGGGLTSDHIESIIIPKRLADTPEFQAMKTKYLDPKGIKVEYDKHDVAPAPASAPKPARRWPWSKTMPSQENADVRILAMSGDSYALGVGDPKANPRMPVVIADAGRGAVYAPVELQQIFKFGTWQDPVNANDRQLIEKLLAMPQVENED